MPLAANLPTDQIDQLSAQIMKQKLDLDSEISVLLTNCQRDPSFTGSAAERYDEFTKQWQTHSEALSEALQGAADLLKQFHDRLVDLDLQVSDGFNAA